MAKLVNLHMLYQRMSLRVSCIHFYDAMNFLNTSLIEKEVLFVGIAAKV